MFYKSKIKNRKPMLILFLNILIAGPQASKMILLNPTAFGILPGSGAPNKNVKTNPDISAAHEESNSSAGKPNKDLKALAEVNFQNIH